MFQNFFSGIGIDVSNHHVRLARVSAFNKIYGLKEIILPVGLVEDEKAVQPNEIKKLIEQGMTEWSLPKDSFRTTVLIPESRVFFTNVVLEKKMSESSAIEEAKNLAPNESFIVKGEYATNWFRLYLGSILLTIFIVIGIFAGIYFLVKFLKKRGGQGDKLGNETNQQTPPQMPQGIINILNLTNAWVSLLSVVLVIGLTYLLNFLGESDLFRFVNIDPVFGVVGVIAIILLYVLIIFGPAVGVATKHGWKSLISILIAEFLWFMVFLIVYLVLFQSGLTTTIFHRGPAVLETTGR